MFPSPRERALSRKVGERHRSRPPGNQPSPPRRGNTAFGFPHPGNPWALAGRSIGERAPEPLLKRAPRPPEDAEQGRGYVDALRTPQRARGHERGRSGDLRFRSVPSDFAILRNPAAVEGESPFPWFLQQQHPYPLPLPFPSVSQQPPPFPDSPHRAEIRASIVDSLRHLLPEVSKVRYIVKTQHEPGASCALDIRS